MLYCAIIGDIIDSRKIKYRQEAQIKFRNVLNTINCNYNDCIASNFTITLGDEFQGLLTKPYLCYEIINEIKEKMRPIEFVFGIGIGEILTDIYKNISIGSDGPAYHYARDMIIKAKKRLPKICYFSNSNEDALVNSLLHFIESCTKRRTKKQLEAISLYDEYKSQYTVAEKLQLSTQSTVSDLLNNAFYYEVKNAEENIIQFLKDKYK